MRSETKYQFENRDLPMPLKRLFPHSQPFQEIRMSLLRTSILTICFAAAIAFCFNDAVQAQGKVLTPPDPGVGSRTADTINERENDGDRGASRSKSAKPKFIDLLENKDLSNFRGYKDEEIGEGWSLDGKYLYFDGSGGGDIITKEVYGDFDLQVEWKVADGANSGIMYRVSQGDSAPYMSGPEYQILDDAEHDDGKNEITSAGSLYGMYPPQGDKKLKAAGSWNKTRIKVEGNKVTHLLNAVKVVQAEIGSDDWNAKLGASKFKDWEKFAKNKEGHIAFQDHGNEVWFRNIRIKRLGESSTSATTTPPASGKTLGAPAIGGGRPGGGRPGLGGPPRPTEMDERGSDRRKK
jgi:hypothetical protein